MSPIAPSGLVFLRGQVCHYFPQSFISGILAVQFVHVNVDTGEVSITEQDYHANRKAAAENDNEKGSE